MGLAAARRTGRGRADPAVRTPCRRRARSGSRRQGRLRCGSSANLSDGDSRLALGQQRYQLVRHVAGGDPGDLGVVVRGRDLDDVRADDVQPGQTAQSVEQLAAGQPAGLGRTRARGMRRVEHVDVDRHVHRPVAEPAPHPLNRTGHPVGLVVVGADDREAEPGVVLQVGVGVQRPADPHMQAPLQVEQALLAGPSKRRAVGVRRPEVGVPGVEVGVEVQHGDRAVIAGQRAEDRQGDGVVAAEAEHRRPVGADAGHRGVDLLHGLLQVERVHRHIAGVGHLQHTER